MDTKHFFGRFSIFAFSLAIFAAFWGMAIPAAAQHTPISADPEFTCGTDLIRDVWLKRTPALDQSVRKMDSVLAHKANIRSLAGKTPVRPQNGPVLFIPVVFHIIHQGGAENISDAQVMRSIEWINDGLRNRGASFRADGVDLMIELCAAERDPDGKPTSPLTRQSNVLTDLTMETQDDALKNLVRWDPSQYLNVWVVREISSLGMGSGVAAYATLPFMAGTSMDGIVTEARWVGGSPAGTTVMVHELGHYFGLWHTFQGGCANDNCLLDGDGVCDTPPDGTTAASPCNNPGNSCTSDVDDTDPRNPFRSTALGGKGDVPDMVTNFMDYGDLACMTRFTPGQDIRMHDAILQYRQPLLASAACIPACTNPPEVAFTPGDMSVLIQTEVAFTNNSEPGLAFKWLVDDVVVSENTNLAFTFTKLGLHTVTLIGYRNAGTDSMCASKFEVTIEVTLEIAKDFEWTLVAPGLHPDPDMKTTDGALSIGRDGSVWTSFKNVSRSVDGGTTWSTTGLLSGWFGTPCIDAFDSTYAIATTVTSGAYFTRDGGTTWTYANGPGTHTYACAFLGDTNRMIFTATTLNPDMKCVISLTTDGGATWNNYNYPEGEILGIEYLGNDILIGAARVNFERDEASILISTDLGRTWSQPVDPTELDYHVWGLASDPCDSSRIVIANGELGVSDLYSTTDRGGTVHLGIPPDIITLTGSVRNGGRLNGAKYLYAHTLDAGVLMSTNHGVSWQSIGGPGGRLHSWMFDVAGDTLLYAMGTNGDVWRAKRINPVGEMVESRHDRVILTVRDVRTDTVGGTVWLPIHSNGLTISADLSFRLTFDPELVFKGAYDKDGAKIPVTEIDQAMGYARLVVPANKAILNSGNVASIEFEMALGGGRVFSVGVDSIQLLSPRLPSVPQCAEFVYTYESMGSSAVTIGPEGCGTEVLGNFVRKGKLPTLRFTPNPAQSKIVLTSDAMLDDVILRVVSASGIIRMEHSLTFAPGKQITLNTSGLEVGAYQILLMTRSGQHIARARLMKIE